MDKLRAGQCARKRRKEMRWQDMKQGKTWKKRREKKCVKGKGWKGKPNGGDRNRWSQTSLQRPRKTCLVWMYTLYAHPRSRQVPMNPKTCFDWLTFSLGPKVQSPKAQRAEHIFVDLLYISFLSNVSSKSSLSEKTWHCTVKSHGARRDKERQSNKAESSQPSVQTHHGRQRDTRGDKAKSSQPNFMSVMETVSKHLQRQHHVMQRTRAVSGGSN